MPRGKESWEDQLSRVRMMAGGGETWDLSDNDRAALQAVLQRVDGEEPQEPKVEPTTIKTLNSDTPEAGGLYLHYKGGVYLVIAVAEHHDTREKMVVYLSLEKGTINVRPFRASDSDPDGWTTTIGKMREGGKLRFARIATK